MIMPHDVRVVQLRNGLRLRVDAVLAWEESENEKYRVLYLSGGHKLAALETVAELDRLLVPGKGP